MHLIIKVPPSLQKYGDFLEGFLEAMMIKLDKNSHKETPTTRDIPGILDLLQLEVDEFELQFNEDKHDGNVLVELADVANFAFLAYVALKLQDLGNGR